MQIDEELRPPQPVRGFYLSELLIGLGIAGAWSSALIAYWRFNPIDSSCVAVFGLLTAFIRFRFFSKKRELSSARRRVLISSLALGLFACTYAALIFDGATRTRHGALVTAFGEYSTVADRRYTDGLAALDAHLLSLGFKPDSNTKSTRRYLGTFESSEPFHIEVRFGDSQLGAYVDYHFYGFHADVVRNEKKAEQFGEKLSDWWKEFNVEWSKAHPN